MAFFELVEAFVAGATAPGAELAVSRQKVGDVEYTVFDAAPDSLRDMFAMMQLHGDLPFIVEDCEHHSFIDLYQRCCRFAHALLDLGVEKGDRVGIFMRNRTEWVVSFIGATLAGAVVTPLNSWWGPDELGFVLADSGAKVLIADPRRAVHVDAMKKPPAGLIKIICCASDGDFADWQNFTKLETSNNNTTAPDIAIGPEDDVSLMYTSGSTGVPKGAISTNRGIVSAVMGYALMGLALKFYKAGGKLEEDTGPQPSILLPIPLFHVTGCVVIFLVSVIAARKLVLMRKWDVNDAMRLIETEKIQTLTGVPTMTADLMNAPDRDQYDLSSLTDLSAGGAARPADQVKLLNEAFGGAAPLAGYGLTETNGIGAFITGDAYLAHPSSIGRAAKPIVELEIRDPQTGANIPDGERGEIWIKSVCNIRGYWNQPEATRETFTDGWLHTGDVGLIDENNLLYIVDRIKDIIIRGGENIATLEVESAVSALDGVLECTVFGLPHKRLGEEVATVICEVPGTNLTAQQVHAALKGTLASYKIPSKIIIQSERLPRIATGKIAKKDIRASLL
ncbi:Long-chain-fatty-acid--CoA ligase [hydrothermal vent metagenome]|uniref:Long-chain-fatty-acid--CoA ligase n=1 Tax=hydrothermal vent metagenome TaxID=652676 RepID=A0A3B0RXJ0_9ZZZZ